MTSPTGACSIAAGCLHMRDRLPLVSMQILQAMVPSPCKQAIQWLVT